MSADVYLAFPDGPCFIARRGVVVDLADGAVTLDLDGGERVVWQASGCAVWPDPSLSIGESVWIPTTDLDRRN